MADQGTGFDMAGLLQRIEEDSKALGARLEAEKDAFLQQLRDAGVAVAEAEYDGSGDSGQIEAVYLFARREDAEEPSPPGPGATQDQLQAYYRAISSPRPATVEDKAIEDLVARYADDLLEATHPGWEINEGSTGEVTIDVESGVITLKHGQRIEDIDWSVDEF